MYYENLWCINCSLLDNIILIKLFKVCSLGTNKNILLTALQTVIKTKFLINFFDTLFAEWIIEKKEQNVEITSL